MRRGLLCRRFPRWLTISGAVYLVFILYYETFCYLLLPFSWPSMDVLESLYPELRVHGSQPTVLRILLAADPQIQGVKNEPPGVLGMITRWDADRYLWKTFHQAARYIDPHLVIFLGDLLDEGTITFGRAYEDYAKRFHNIFSLPKAKVIYLPGDNDVGGEGGEFVTDENLQRFRSNFRSDGRGFWDESVKIVEVSGLTDPVVLNDAVNTTDKKPATILIGHIPILFGNPAPHTVKLLDELKPAIIFSAHNHKASVASRSLTDKTSSRSSSVTSDYSIYDLSPSPSSVQEIVLPTCSYRMGVPKMGFGFVVIDLATSQLFYTVLWLPPRYPHLFNELTFTIFFFLIFLFGFSIEKYQKSRRGKVRFSV